MSMSKAIISISYDNYVMDVKDALLVAEAMANAERYENRWVKSEDGNSGDYTHYIYPNDKNRNHGIVDIKLLPDALYKLAKLAGKPQK